MQEMPPPPGWYPDPQVPDVERYWNGKMWAKAARPAPGAIPMASAKANRRAIGIAVIAVAIAGAAMLALNLGGSDGTAAPEEPGYRVNADEAGIGFGWAAREDSGWRCSITPDATIACLGGVDETGDLIDLAPGKRSESNLLGSFGRSDGLVVRYDLTVWACDKGALGVVCAPR